MDAIGTPNAFNPGPPLYDPVRQILVHYDTIGRQVAAHAYGGPGSLDLLWTLPFCNTVQMMLYPDTGELVLEDSPHALTSGGDFKDGAVVVVDIGTGEEKGRAPIHEKGTMGMFLCPGFGRDFYVSSIGAPQTNASKQPCCSQSETSSTAVSYIL